MVFPSYVFLYLFLPLVLSLYWISPRRVKPAWLLLASLAFYGWADARFLLLVGASTTVDYVCGLAITAARARGGRGRPWLLLSVVGNLGALAWFKYANFGVENLQLALQALGFESVGWTTVLLPVGISFYTFQSMSYTIDVFRGETRATRDPIVFASYVTMFPQLVAGPIVRWRDMEHQITRPTIRWSWIADGLLFLQLGLAKKILIADSVAPVADAAFAAEAPTMAAAWLGTAAYTIQLYFDFSGYSDMAIGLGLLLGYRFPINFDRPYVSRSITEFWRRWHISLSRWLRDYLYVPLGGNRKGRWLTYRNLWLTMLLGGLWHGAAWTFVIWGAWHGGWLALERAAGKRGLWSQGPRLIAVPLTLLIVMIGWVFFRADDLPRALGHLAAMVGFSGGEPVAVNALGLGALTLGSILALFTPTTQKLVATRPGWLALILPIALVLTLLQIHHAQLITFLYFRF